MTRKLVDFGLFDSQEPIRFRARGKELACWWRRAEAEIHFKERRLGSLRRLHFRAIIRFVYCGPDPDGTFIQNVLV